MKRFFRIRIKLIIWLQISLQFFFPIITAFPALANTTNNQTEGESIPYENILSSTASSLSSSGADGMKNMGKNMATGAAASTVEQWLSQFGTAKVQLSVDDDGHWDQSSVELFTPVFDNKKSIWFTPFGMRAGVNGAVWQLILMPYRQRI
ncbi:inverse autotransporter beta domain-containing protein [Hafnia paralvei]|uniref:inverse autotransporter beta domain-containing protein n=1 Tax=Hafnia paralvei TaxID=546367 RepID=UPI003CFAAEC9